MPAPADRLAALRILDANYNRASEGLRVVEEHCRLVLSDRRLTEWCKTIRHQLGEAFRQIPEPERLAAREAAEDVGADLTVPQESERQSLHAIAAASCARAEQALRAIEEYGKLVAAPLAAEAKRLRFEVYTLSKASLTAAHHQQRLEQARLYVLLDGGATEQAFCQRVAALVAAGVHMLQLRDKSLDDRTLLARARILREQTRGTGTLFIMNDRPDLAALSHADGVHVGQEELSIADVRRIVGPQMLVGVSTHSIEQVRQAVREGASYLGCGPTFPSGTKAFAAFPGLDFLHQASRETALPAFAIGGITLENVAQVLQTGFARIAVSGAIASAADLPTTLAQWLAALPKGLPQAPPHLLP